MMFTVARSSWRELDERSGDGLVVTLQWDRACDIVRVLIEDERTGDTFVVYPEAWEVLEAFEHPFRFHPLRVTVAA